MDSVTMRNIYSVWCERCKEPMQWNEGETLYGCSLCKQAVSFDIVPETIAQGKQVNPNVFVAATIKEWLDRRDRSAIENGFLKFDKDKPRPELIPNGFIVAMGKVMAYGAKKYATGNWAKCDDISRYIGAAMRHLCAYNDGEVIDPESGCPHLAHAGCSVAMAFGLHNIHNKKEN